MSAGAGRSPVTAWIGLGANLGDARAALHSAFARLAVLAGTQLLRRSSIWRSAPIDSSGPDYLNAVAELSTTLTAPDLLAALQRIELDHGRERPYRNAPRTLDLDLLLYGDATIVSPRLLVPHPRLTERAFVLRPLAELAPGLRVPGDAVCVADRLPAVADQRIEVDPGLASPKE